MTTTQVIQEISLIISLLVVLIMFFLGLYKPNQRGFYISMILGWIPGIFYYVMVIWFYEDFREIFSASPTDISALLRVYQYTVFGSWFLFDALEIIRLNICKTKVYYHVKNKIILLLNKRSE